MDALPARSFGDLGEASLSAVRWMSASRLVAEVAGVGSTVVVARLVSPAEFGHAAVALIVVVLAIGIANYAVSAPLVQRRSLEQAHVEAAALVTLIAGLTLSASTFLVAPLLVGPIFGERVVDLVRLVSPAFLLACVGAVPHALRSRALDFRRLGLIEAASTVVGAATAVALALAGLDAESVVLGGLARLASSTGLLLASGPRAAPRWHARPAGDLAGFGIPACVASLAYTAFQNVDYAIVAARLSAAQTGFYWRAYQLSVVYQEKVSGVVMRIAFPVYARSHDLEQLRRVRLRMGRAQTMILFPCLAALIAVAPQLVPLAFGSQWAPAGVPTQILAVTGMALVAVTGTTPLLWAAGKPHGLAAFNVALLTGYAVLVILVAPFGLIPLCAAVSCFSVVALSVQLALEKTVGGRLREIWASFAPALVASGVELAVAYPVAQALSGAGLSDALVVLCVAGIAWCTYAASARLLFPAAWADTVLLVRRLVVRERASRETRGLVAQPGVAE
jgi:O-antigen/teichoic acid export membrane protein